MTVSAYKCETINYKGVICDLSLLLPFQCPMLEISFGNLDPLYSEIHLFSKKLCKHIKDHTHSNTKNGINLIKLKLKLKMRYR